MARADLATFGRMLGALYTEAMQCVAETEDKVAAKAWQRVRDALADAVQAADQREVCQCCGEVGELVRCQWCGMETCGRPACLAELNDHVDPETHRCPNEPEPKVKRYEGPEDPDINF